MHLAIFLLALGVLSLEILTTRIFSVVLWYHYGFLAISLAMFGFGLAGVYVYAFPSLGRPEGLRARVTALSVASGVTAIAAVSFFIRYSQNPDHWPLGWTALLWMVLAFLVPFALSGLAITMILLAGAKRVSSLYAADLTGAALGCLLVVAGLGLVSGPEMVFVVGGLFALAGLAMWGRRDVAIAGIVVTAVLVGVLVGATRSRGSLDITRSKTGSREEIIAERWNSFSRVTVTESPIWSASGWDLSRMAPPSGMGAKLIRIDDSAYTQMMEYDGDLSRVGFLRYDVTAFGYWLGQPGSALVIGSGGGRDVLTALHAGFDEVTAVEINPDVIAMTHEDFADYSGDPYSDPRVRWVAMDGRAYTARSDETYDVIQVSAVDTQAATAAGAYTLAENSLYTVEAFRDFWEHLEPDGLLCVSRGWRPVRAAALRLTVIAEEAMRVEGVGNPRQHLALVAGKRWCTLLMKKSPFTPDEIATLREKAKELEFLHIYDPGSVGDETFREYFADPQRFLRDYSINVTATTDTRPYFFFHVWPRDLLNLEQIHSENTVVRGNRMAARLVGRLLLVMAGLVVLFLFVVPAVIGRLGRFTSRDDALAMLYFMGIGLGFIMVEIPVLQRVTVFLGKPVHALSVVLFSFLLFSGLGAARTSHVAAGRELEQARKVLPVLIALQIVLTLVAEPVIRLLQGTPEIVRILVAVGFIAPLATLMGMIFPLGFRVVEARHPRILAWCWAVNGGCSVLGSIVSVVLSVLFGYGVAIAVGIGAYALTWASSRALR